MLTNFQQVINHAIEQEKLKVSVAAAHDIEVLAAVESARKLGMIEGILIGNVKRMEEIAGKLDIDLRKYELVGETDLTQACRKAVKKVSSGEAEMLMKGLVDTSIILKAVLDKEIGLRTNRILSHVSVSKISKFDRFILMSDGGMNIYPDLKSKADIIENAVAVARALGNECPKVALVCAKEKVDDKMPCTVDAKMLEEMNKNGILKDCIVGGPFGLDNAISQEAAKHKGVEHPVAGKADIIIVPNIESGNIFYKSVVYFSDSQNSGVIMGAKAPIILTSRADSDETKLNAIAVAKLIASANIRRIRNV